MSDAHYDDRGSSAHPDTRPISERTTAQIRQPTPAPTYQPGRIVTDEQVDRALHSLQDDVRPIGDAKAAMTRADHMMCVTEALMFLKSDQTSDVRRKMDARSSSEYLKWTIEHATAAGEFQRLLAARESASLIIEVWRTQGANMRKANI